MVLVAGAGAVEVTLAKVANENSLLYFVDTHAAALLVSDMEISSIDP